MQRFSEILKYQLAPKKLYLSMSASRKFHRARRKGELEIELLPFLADPSKTAIDIGANKGMYTYFLAKLARDVIAFEPHTKLCKFLEKATPGNVTVINKGLSNSRGRIDLHVPLVNGKEALNMSTFEPALIKEYKTTSKPIEVTRLDDFKFKNIGFIKIDVEGHELNVLEGARETIEQEKPVFLIEILAEREQLNSHPVLAFMAEKGYRALTLHNDLLCLLTPSAPKSTGRNFIFLPDNR